MGYNTLGAEDLLSTNETGKKINYDNSISELYYLMNTSSIFTDADKNYYSLLVAKNTNEEYQKRLQDNSKDVGDYISDDKVSIKDNDDNKITVFSGIYGKKYAYVNPITVYSIVETTNFFKKSNTDVQGLISQLEDFIKRLSDNPNSLNTNTDISIINSLDRISKSFLIKYLMNKSDTKSKLNDPKVINNYLNNTLPTKDQNDISKELITKLKTLFEVNDPNIKSQNNKNKSDITRYLSQVLNAYVLLKDLKTTAEKKLINDRNLITKSLNDKNRIYSSLNVVG
jgi:hypothetical protein